MKKSGSAVWQGGIKDGAGSVSTETGVLKDAAYGFNSRFGEGKGTNPEELLGAAHAGCFSMALANQLGEAKLTPERIETQATVTLDKDSSGFVITDVHLQVSAKVPGATQENFQQAARAAKEGCPVSRLFNANITMEARLLD
ncbi:OsmC family protein [Verticiella sediminum]|uniref:OsmC family protein n=1 Tax=Verticiella sediminum TaxID=1247510 RepID=A0A556AS99_9BURK|nr:OsmC family protein [Verticiella sediminum]TSH95813.1 OsmC family protein [Verticiella sediminum]